VRKQVSDKVCVFSMHVCGEREIERERERVDVCISMVYHCTNRAHKEKGVDQREGVEETREKTRKLSVSVALPFATSPAVACVCTVVE